MRQSELKLRNDQLVLEGDHPVLNSDVLRFAQVFANLIGGSVRVPSQPGEGTTCIFEWPKAILSHREDFLQILEDGLAT